MEWLLDLIFPKYCLSCRTRGTYVCPGCLSKTTKRGLSTGQIISLWKYEGVIKKAIWVIKYQFAYQVGNELADLASEEISQRGYFKGKKLLCVCIPLHIKRARWRGFNQAEIIARRIASNLGWPFKANILVRTKQTKTQVGLHKKGRLRNIRGNFAVNDEAKAQIEGKRIIVFDDVTTTGATLTEVMKLLKKAGVKEVWGMTIAR